MKFFTIFGLVVLGGPLMASSISYVTTDTTAGGAANNYDSATGLNQSPGNCYAQGSTLVVPCGTLSSTPSTNTLGATSSSVAINAQSYDPQNGVSGYSNSSASANLATGTVGVYAAGLPCSPTTPLCSDGGTAVAEIQDSLTFSNTTGSTQDITLSWTFDGSLTSNGAAFDSYSLLSLFCFASGTGCAGNANSIPHGPISTSLFEFQDSAGTVTNTQPSSGWVSTSIIPGSNGTSETFQGVFAVPTGVSVDSLNAYLAVLQCTMYTCDFSHTGQFGMSALPDGVSFTSSSGVLLTSQTSEAPEPRASWLICLAALGACALVRRGRWFGADSRREEDISKGNLAGTTGLEPATSDVTGRRSNQLNYVPEV